MRRFNFLRDIDVSGISGTGIVGEGVELSDGKVVFTWLTKLKSIAIYENIETFITVHGHEGKGYIRWID